MPLAREHAGAFLWMRAGLLSLYLHCKQRRRPRLPARMPAHTVLSAQDGTVTLSSAGLTAGVFKHY